MTLGDLIRKAREVGNQFNTWDVPLYDEDYCEIKDVDLCVEKDEEGYFVRLTVNEAPAKEKE